MSSKIVTRTYNKTVLRRVNLVRCIFLFISLVTFSVFAQRGTQIEIRGTTNLEMAAIKERGSSFLQGVLLDDKGDPLVGSTVEIEVHSLKTLQSTMHEEKTNAQGEFRVTLDESHLPFQISAHFPGSEKYEGTKIQQQVDAILSNQSAHKRDWKKYAWALLIPLGFVLFRVWRKIQRYKKEEFEEERKKQLAVQSKISTPAERLTKKINKRPQVSWDVLDRQSDDSIFGVHDCYEVSGTVCDFVFGSSLEGVTVELISTDQQTHLNTITNRDGKFNILPEKESKKFFLKINKKGYASFSKVVDLPHNGKWKDKNIALKNFRTKILEIFHESLVQGIQDLEGFEVKPFSSLSHEVMVEKIIAAGKCGEELRRLQSKVERLSYGPKEPTKEDFDNIKRALQKTKPSP